MEPQATARLGCRGSKMMWLLLAAALIPLGGCVNGQYYEYSEPYRLIQDYGVSVANNASKQMVNAPSMVDPRPAVGLSPQAAQSAFQDRYEKSFREKEPPPTIIQLAPSSGK